jgi:tetratricopeptide (TPR) repeat protein
VNLASIQMELGRPAEAIETAERVCRDAPFDARGHYLAGRALYETEAYAEALEHLDRAARLDPRQVDTQIAIGMCQAALDAPAACLRAFERARSLAPNDPDVLFNLGLAYEDAASVSDGAVDLGEAASLYRRVLELAPGYEAARKRLDALRSEDAD